MFTQGQNNSHSGGFALFSCPEFSGTERSSMTEYITNIPVEKLKPFPNHPFQVRDDDSMKETVESIKTYRVLQPTIVRPSKDGDYEILIQYNKS